ncbi:phytoene desaturase family protein [Veronia pacifica]|uniref:Phytoene dehydrogenase n=1 Tax=Veronia pacifica TaxID=1080227 RepID=A0A1C3EIC8_9GAMM|nr:phytoene desaturase family protein [Veronia pacifica]ODA33002.1 phytoene dehydrogenase [Veronia pacifica]
MPHAVVIGAGFGGIAASLRLRARGYDVTIVDRCSSLGGRAQVYDVEGFRHDAGPTVVTAPFLLEELFSLFGESLHEHVELVPLEPWYRFHFPDGGHFDYGGSLDKTLSEIARVSAEDVDGYQSLVNESQQIFDVGFTKLADKPFHQFSTMLAQLPYLVKLGSHRSVWKFVSKHLKSDKLRQAFSIQPLLVGGNPFDTTCIYSLIHYLERKWGIFFPTGGTGALVEALGNLMKRQGIAVKLNTTVTGFTFDNKTIKNVEMDDGSVMDADLVVSNGDPAFIYENLIPKSQQTLPCRLKTNVSEKSMGLYVLYFGTTKQYSDVAHHTIWLGKRYKELLEDIFHHKTLTEDFSLYVHRPTATDPSFAPDGCDSFYVLAPVPNQEGNIDWTVEGSKLKDRIVNALEQTLLPELSEHIKGDFFKTPDDFAQSYLSAEGAGFSIAPLFRQSAWFRYHNQGEGIDNLYLVGAGTHPGAGLPGVLSSAKVLERLIPDATLFRRAS